MRITHHRQEDLLALRDFDPAYDRNGSATAVSHTPALGLLHLSHPTLAVRIRTAGS
jgi:hypothetical protein